MQEQKPLVSIIVRTKDRPKLLIRALQSIAVQTYRPIEVVLVNDGGCELSEDELKTILGDIHLNYIRLEKNMGRAHAGNVGIENVKGEYIGFLDDDDEFYPEHVITLVSFLEQSEYKVAYTDSLMVYKGYDPQTYEILEARKGIVYSEDFSFDKLIIDNYIPFMCLLFKKEVIASSIRFDTGFELYEDWDLIIRVAEKNVLCHIKQITADYNQWSSAAQIAQENKDKTFIRDSYLKLYSKHFDKFNPQRIYDTINLNREQYHYIKSLEAFKDTHIENLDILIKDRDTQIKDKDTHISNLKDVIVGKDQLITSLVSKISQKDIEMTQKNQYLIELESLLEEKESSLQNIYTSQGWKILLEYYKIRDKILPLNSVRRRFLKDSFNLLLSIPTYLTKKKTESTGGKLYFHIETDLSKPFIIGAGNALYIRGWCFHTARKIKKLSILVDDTPHRVLNFALARKDVFQQHFQNVENMGNSLNSGFWIILPFNRIDLERRVNLSITAELSNREVCTSSIGALHLKSTYNVNKNRLHVLNMASKAPLITICMTTYNPSIGHFQKQIDSIIHQTYQNWICIINDDCSPPELFGNLKNIVSSDGRFRIYRNTTNLGFYYNFEKCLSFVPEETAFIALSDQDDYWHDNKLSILLSHFDEKTILVYSDMNIVDEKGTIIHPTYWTTRRNNFTELDLLIIANTITGAASIFRKELLNFLLPFPEKIGDSYHDNFIACAALTLGDIKYEGASLYDYRQHSENVFGHKVPPIINKKECFLNFFRKITTINSGFAKSFQQTLINYQTVYCNDFIRRILIAHVLNLRCYTSSDSEEKKKTIRRFMNFEKGLYGIVFEVIKNKILKKGLVTVGNDAQLLKSVLSVRLLNKYNSFLRYLPIK